jgi:hypothetical protein
MLGSKGIDIGLECKWVAETVSQQEAEREWSGSQCYQYMRREH